MELKILLVTCITGGVLAMTSAYADHNSVWGAGHANITGWLNTLMQN